MRQRVDFHEKNLTSKALPLCTASRNLGKLGKEIFQKLETYTYCGRKNIKACLAPESPEGPTLAEQGPESCPCLRRSPSDMRPVARAARREEGGPGAHFVLCLRTSRPVHPLANQPT